MVNGDGIGIRTREEISILSEAGKILSGVVRNLVKFSQKGVATRDIDAYAESLIRKAGAIPAFKGYRGFPASVCVSINEQVVHGIPSNRLLMEGDLVSLDVGIAYKGYYSDMAVTIGIGQLSPVKKDLLEVARKALYKGIDKAKVGNRLSDISHAIQRFVESNRCSVVRDFVGHGIGKKLHENPEIPNFGAPHRGPLLKEGMVFAIEPMVNLGTWQTRILNDKWTVVTEDGKPSAHFEHTVAILKEGPKILTE